jgi:hypothetical protein
MLYERSSAKYASFFSHWSNIKATIGHSSFKNFIPVKGLIYRNSSPTCFQTRIPKVLKLVCFLQLYQVSTCQVALYCLRLHINLILIVTIYCWVLWVQIPPMLGVLDATLCDQVCQWLAAGRWFSLCTPVSSTNKTDRHNIAEILLKVVLSTIILTSNRYCRGPNGQLSHILWHLSFQVFKS